MEKGTEIFSGPEAVDDFKKTLFSEHSRSAVQMTHVNSSQTKSQHGEGMWVENPTPA